ncbi:carbohydrate kinase [Rhodobacteraceae bacterium F11138]|nr:carbohydrate kinase [Rhodobacteraceae bacterium F11138]
MILCCGEALIDMLPATTTTGADAFVPCPGGAVFNTAIALGRLGVQTGLLSGLSLDLFGRQLTEALKASHVDLSHVVTSERPTTLAFVRLVDGHATYSFFDENSAGRMLNASDMPTLAQDITALFLGGISLACEPCADAYAGLLARESSKRAVILDPNVRPDFIHDIDGYRARLDRMMRLADVVKVSDEDLNWLDPSPLSLTAKIETLLQKGPGIVILTRGGDGATGYMADGTVIHAQAQPVKIVDTVGAGDTFNAGFMAKLSGQGVLCKTALHALSPDLLAMAMRHASRAAAVTVSRSGANPPWSTEL